MKTVTRVQVQLKFRQLELLKRMAAERGVSVSELVREGVSDFLRDRRVEEANRRDLAKSARGRFASGLGNLSERHDDYLGGRPDAGIRRHPRAPRRS